VADDADRADEPVRLGRDVELAELTGIPAPTLRALAAESTLLAASLGL
jgi:hypothetical protein